MTCARYLHTADGWTLCGSSGSRFCLVLAGGRWAWSRQLGSKRAGHASWRVPGGVLLLGGWGSPRTVDLLTDGGTVQRNPFLLKYPIKYQYPQSIKRGRCVLIMFAETPAPSLTVTRWC